MPLEKDAHEKDAVPLPIPEKHTLHRSLPRNRVDVDLSKYGIIDTPYRFVYRNIEPAFLYELAFRTGEENIELIHTGAINAKSGVKTGRCPQDKRIVEEESSKDDVWWGKINIKLAESSFQVNKQTAVDYFNTRNTLYVVDGFAGWDEKYRIKVRMIGCQTYHALFMWNMLIRPTPEQLESFGEPDYVIYSAGQFPANKATPGMTSATSVCLNFKSREQVILGTQYAGEMKKGIFTVMNYLMPKQGILSMHASCNEGKNGDVSIFFGLSGTGKTTLSADPRRSLIGDDEHAWGPDGVFNIEGGCYAKCINLSREKEPEIYDAIKFGSVLENVVVDPVTRAPNYKSEEITENTRVAYPLEYIPNAKLPAICGHPKNIIYLTCDAFGVLPPVARLTVKQAMYHFISGYTSKVAGTEVGITEPQATFSACFGEPFMVWHPVKYATLLAEQLSKHNATVWLVNTGWVGGSALDKGVKRIALRYTRAMIDAIHNGDFLKLNKWENSVFFDLEVPVECTGVPSDILNPRNIWKDKAVYDAQLKKLAEMFIKNFEQYEDKAGAVILSGGPKL